MKDKVSGFFFMSLLVTIGLIWIISNVGVLGMIKLTNGCLVRYSSSGGSTDALSHSVTLQSTGNYNNIIDLDSGLLVPDPSSYGQWLNTGIDVTQGNSITLEISSGSVSLCQAFLPSYNAEQNTSTGNINPVTNAPIVIPRVGDATSLQILLPANLRKWVNVAAVDQYDQISVSLRPSVKPVYTNGILTADVSSLSYTSAITGATTNNINCSDGRTTYSPVCGIYSVYPIGGIYGTGCHNASYSCNKHCTQRVAGVCTDYGYDTCRYWQGTYSGYPHRQIPSYNSNGQYTMPYSTDISRLVNYDAYPLCSLSNARNGGDNCNNDKPGDNDSPFTNMYNNGNFCYTYCTANPSASGCSSRTDFALPAPANPKFWFRSDDGTGLLYRFDNSLNPTNSNNLGSAATVACSPSVAGYCFAPQPTSAGNYNVLSVASNTADTKYLQYRLLDNNGSYSDNTGGYVLNIQQTKCQRSSGAYVTDSYPNRGQVQYVIVPAGGDEPTNYDGGGTTGTGITFDNNRRFVLTPSATGTLWMLVSNKFDDYKYSTGQYDIGVITSVPTSKFGDNILTPLLAGMKKIVDKAGKGVFQNMTCYNSSTSPCTNFFTYIKLMLTLYIMLFGLMFLAGMTEITTEDLVIRVIKITIVAGLMDGSTYTFFNQYVFGFVTSFSDQIISNLAGFNLYSNGGVVNPLMFSDELMTKILFSKTTFAQMLALFSFGIAGVFFFLMIFMGIMMIVAAIIRSFAVYIMAFVALAFLLSLAPLFLTFLLFEKTYYLFEGWTRAIFRFMLEPVILFAGIIILTQLAEIYIDNILGWSVCWKCTLAFSLPFPSFPLLPSFFTAPLFCINWFAPWGYDYRSGLMGIAIGDIVGFGIICFCAYGYGDFSTKMLQQITNSPAGATASGAAGTAIKSFSEGLSKAADSIKKRTGVDLKSASPSQVIGKARGAIGEVGNKALSMTPGGRVGSAMKAAKEAGSGKGDGGGKGSSGGAGGGGAGGGGAGGGGAGGAGGAGAGGG